MARLPGCRSVLHPIGRSEEHRRRSRGVKIDGTLSSAPAVARRRGRTSSQVFVGSGARSASSPRRRCGCGPGRRVESGRPTGSSASPTASTPAAGRCGGGPPRPSCASTTRPSRPGSSRDPTGRAACCWSSTRRSRIVDWTRPRRPGVPPHARRGRPGPAPRRPLARAPQRRLGPRDGREGGPGGRHPRGGRVVVDAPPPLRRDVTGAIAALPTLAATGRTASRLPRRRLSLLHLRRANRPRTGCRRTTAPRGMQDSAPVNWLQRRVVTGAATASVEPKTVR